MFRGPWTGTVFSAKPNSPLWPVIITRKDTTVHNSRGKYNSAWSLMSQWAQTRVCKSNALQGLSKVQQYYPQNTLQKRLYTKSLRYRLDLKKKISPTERTSSLHFCVSFHKTTPDQHPLPRIQNLIDRIAGNSCFSILDQFVSIIKVLWDKNPDILDTIYPMRPRWSAWNDPFTKGIPELYAKSAGVYSNELAIDASYSFSFINGGSNLGN